MIFVSIVGHAIFQTARASGPSTIERSYRGFTAGADAGGVIAAAAAPASLKSG
jgi:hypothetical protein